MSAPRFSIIVPVRRAESTIRQTIASLLEQCDGRQVEVILAVCRIDPTYGQLTAMAGDAVRLLVIDEPAGVPQLRRDAARLATGDFIILVEDHCRFPVGWLSGIESATRQNPGDVVGGPVENGRLRLAGWAQYFTRYSGFLPSTPEGLVRNLPGNNACYPARLIRDRPTLLEKGFWEAEFNHELAREGILFHSISALAVTQYQDRGAIEYAPLRFRHGRCYGARRAATLTAAERCRLVLLCPALPILLFFRIARAVWRSQRNRAAFCGASPLILIYVFAWSMGEIAGYFTGPADSCTNTD